MAQTLGKNSARPKIDYKVKIIDDTDVNAFTLPNGNVLSTPGCLISRKFGGKIAAVMAHEIGHNAEMHALRGASKAGKASLIGMAAMLAALIGGGKNGTDVALFSQYLLTGIISGYSVEYEKEANTSAVGTMEKSGYNPSALVTVMQRFEIEEKRHPKSDQQNSTPSRLPRNAPQPLKKILLPPVCRSIRARFRVERAPPLSKARATSKLISKESR